MTQHRLALHVMACWLCGSGSGLICLLCLFTMLQVWAAGDNERSTSPDTLLLPTTRTLTQKGFVQVGGWDCSKAQGQRAHRHQQFANAVLVVSEVQLSQAVLGD